MPGLNNYVDNLEFIFAVEWNREGYIVAANIIISDLLVLQALIVSCCGCFHGRTLAAVSMSCDNEATRGFWPLLGGNVKIDFGDADALESVLAGEFIFQLSLVWTLRNAPVPTLDWRCGGSALMMNAVHLVVLPPVSRIEINASMVGFQKSVA